MSPLAVRIGAGVLALLALIALRGKRWAYFAFVLLGLLYFPAQAHFRVHVPKCELLLPTVQQLVPLLHNYVYIALFAGFYWISWVQLRDANARGLWAFIATLVAAALFELSEGMTAVVAVAKTVRHAGPAVASAAQPHCRVQDLVPAVAAALGAAVLLAIWARLTKKPAYVRLGSRRPAAAPAPRATAPPPRAAASPRVIYSPPPPPPLYAPPPVPPDFSPGPEPETVETHAAQTEEVAPRRQYAGRSAFMQSLQPILRYLQPILGRLRAMFHRVWSILWGRRRAIGVGLASVVLIGAGALLFQRLRTPATVATQPTQDSSAALAPPEPPPPPPRPLQSEVEGYYEPNYQFTVFDRRFSRLTLRPTPSVTFTRPGTRQEVGCEDARVSPTAVHLRCQLEPYGAVTIEGRFASRYASGQLDMPVLSGVITVTNNRGEVVYRARDSFYWHVPD